MGDLSKNFSRSEFACKGTNCCGHSAPIQPELISALQALRDQVSLPLSITSGFRCNHHNESVGGAAQSFHTLGMAADVDCSDGLTAEDLARAAETIPAFQQGGIGIYPSWVHLDVRTTGKARWRND
ncbi:YcbK family protein [Desulfatibacillum aliphaticivorans]|uniref:YcbK family protein n=1 Tax=Desulfatibacillum aliphaticivorans TaxID=218208 RepID=UPI0004884058|nr:D-Ala-D-Ala carboxypeptidase family metallohydrolase [Desulfatibacillum aliphaticivorans]